MTENENENENESEKEISTQLKNDIAVLLTGTVYSTMKICEILEVGFCDIQDVADELGIDLGERMYTKNHKIDLGSYKICPKCREKLITEDMNGVTYELCYNPGCGYFRRME